MANLFLLAPAAALTFLFGWNNSAFLVGNIRGSGTLTLRGALFTAVVGLLAGSMIGRGWLAAGAILGVGLIENDAGLAAAVLFLSAFTIALSVGMALRPLEKGRE